MKHTFKYSLMFVVLILALMTSAIGVTPALADDGTPPASATEEVTQPPADEPVAEQEPVAAEEPVVAPQEEVTVAEALEQLPDDTTLVVLDEGGEALPLVSEAAAEVLAAPDPYFTVGGNLYQFSAADCDPLTAGDQPCATPFQTALNFLANVGSPPDDNTVYVEAGTYDENVSMNGLFWMSSIPLVLSGAGSGSTTLNGTLTVSNWESSFTLQGFTFNDTVKLTTYQGNVTLNDVVVDGTDTSGRLSITIDGSEGDITLQNVESHNSSGDGATLWTQGDISVSNSIFANNSDYGLSAEAGGDISVSDSTFQENNYAGLETVSGDSITLDGVTASANEEEGALVEAAGDVSVSDSVFQDNADEGVLVDTGGSITLDGVSANGNGTGAHLAASGDVSVSNSTFNSNAVDGLYVSGYSDVTLNNVIANGNLDVDGDGAYIFVTGDLIVTDSTFNGNTAYGLGVKSRLGSVTLNGVTASGNSMSGARISAASETSRVDVFCSDFSDNGDWGLNTSTPDLYLNGTTFSGNISGDYVNAMFGAGPGNVWINEHDCLVEGPETPLEESETPAITWSVEAGDRNGQHDELPMIIIRERLDVEVPSELLEGNTFVSSLQVLMPEGGNLPRKFMVTLALPIPAGMKDAELAVLYWNGEKWVAGPGGAVVKNPPGHVPGDYFIVTVTALGTYVLVSQ